MSDDIKSLKQFIKESQAQNFEDLKQYIDARFSQSGSRFDEIDERFEELKQYIDARFSQSGSRFDEIDERFDRLREEMKQGFLGVGEAIDEIGADTDERFADHESRINRLKHRAA